MNFQTDITSNYFKHLPQDIAISFQTDIGNDPDDALALFLLMQAMKQKEIPKGSLKEIVTTLFNPGQKAVIAAKICNFMNNCEIPIYPDMEALLKSLKILQMLILFGPPCGGYLD